jgi:membrane-associated phospholipid phosphatase
MLTIVITAGVMIVAGAVVWACFRYWPGLRTAPRVDPAAIRREVRRHPRLAAAVSSRMDPSVITGLALTTAAAVTVVGGAAVGLVIFMVRVHFGFADFDGSAARFAARNATSNSTTILRVFTQLGGAVVLVPLSVLVWALTARRRGLATSLAFLVVTVGGQFALADIIKWIVDRTRPNFDRLTGFSGPSFPSGHATASAACLAAFALLLGLGRSARVQTALASAAVALAVGIACSRVFLGVHWLTDVLAGLALGWAWFALCSIVFGGRLLRFGAPAEDVEMTMAEAEARNGRRAAV